MFLALFRDCKDRGSKFIRAYLDVGSVCHGACCSSYLGIAAQFSYLLNSTSLSHVLACIQTLALGIMIWKPLFVASLIGLGVAQFPPKPEGVTRLKSKFHENVTLSFKEVSDVICISWLNLPID